jgi:peptidoglycan/LPS O-acetylase OafA/YrhL
MSQKTLLRHAGKPAAGAPKSSFRRDIQGLRAVAVLAVVADHLFKWPSGGFVGVDVFFVISGFLITGLLLKEHDRTGSISFTGFYKRRARRILPASMVALLGTVAGAYFLFGSTRFQQVLTDGVWATLFAGNWRFAIAGTDYFQAGGPVSPLQHFWSLAVEEQFYFVWPWVMLLVFVLGGKSSKWDQRVAHRAVGVAMIVIIVSSFLWAMFETTTNPTVAYFSTLSRAWELGIGALLAVGAGVLAKLPQPLRPALAALGLAGIFASFFLITTTSTFPAPWAALPVLATALVIAAGTGSERDSVLSWPLTNRFSTYVGAISYSLYLWHFPAIILLQTLLPEGITSDVLILAAAFALAAASYHGVENPIRKSSWLADGKKSRGQAGSSLPYVGLGALALVTAVVTAIALIPPAVPVSSAAPVANPSTPASAAAAAPVDLAERQSGMIGAALSATAWPELAPAIDNAEAAKAEQMVADTYCMHPQDFTTTETCTYGPAGATKTAVVVGDSVAISWMPALVEALGRDGYKVRGIGFGACPFVLANVTLENLPADTERCNRSHAGVIDLVTKINPDMVVLSNHEGGLAALSSGASGAAGRSEWVEARSEAMRALSAPQRKVVMLSPPPAGRNPAECYTKLSKPSDCVSGIDIAWKNMADADKTAAEASGATYVDSSSWFCQFGKCPVFVGSTPVRYDILHLTSTYGKQIAPLLKAAILS